MAQAFFQRLNPFSRGNTTSGDPNTRSETSLSGETAVDELQTELGKLRDEDVSLSDSHPIGSGVGSFGKVYPGHYSSNGTNIRCAVKIFDVSKTTHKAIMREYSLGKGDVESHANIVEMYGLWYGYDHKLSMASSGMPTSTTPLPALVMELCNTNLWEYLKKIKNRNEVSLFRLRTKLKILMDVSKAMAFLHEKGIVHSDLSAANVLLQNVGNEGADIVAKVTDFGLARELDQSTNRHSTTITVNNDIMPPEVKRGAVIILSPSADVFSFGCLVVFVACCVFPEPTHGDNEFMRRRHYINQVKPVERGVLEPLMKRCLSDAEEDRGNFGRICKDLLENIQKVENKSAIHEEEEMYDVQVLQAKLNGSQRLCDEWKAKHWELKKLFDHLKGEKASADEVNEELGKDNMHLNSELKKIREENLVLTTKLDSLQLQQPNFEAQGKMFKEYHDALVSYGFRILP
jgi:serine/threonine protein kinase